MTSRGRILTALAGGEPDRVPVSTYELVGRNSRAFENNDPSYAPLMRVIREKTDCLCMWEPGSNETFLGSAHPVDMETVVERGDGATVTRRVLHTPKGDITSAVKVFDNVHTTWQLEHWCKSPADVDRALSIPYLPPDYDVSDYARAAGEVGEGGVIMDSLADPLWMAADLMEFGDYTLWALTEPEHFTRTVEVMRGRCLENLRRRLDARTVDLYRICGPEYATPPYLPPEFFDAHVTPHATEMITMIHEAGALARFHCHGKIGQVLDMIARTGADGLDPCEAPPDGDIELAEVKVRVGGRMCLFGNLQLKLLEQGTPDMVARAVRDCMDAAKRGGGYVIMPTAAPINTPLSEKTVENYLCFIETALSLGAY